MTDILLIQGHPDPEGGHLCHAIGDAYRQAAESNGHTVEVIDVARQNVTFLRSKTEWEATDLPAFAATGQTAVQAARHIVIIYPLWLGDIPAILKAWIEHVLREGFAFETGNRSWRGKLGGKTARVIVTMGMPGLAYRWFFLAHSLRSLDRNILKFCGIRPVRWSIFGNAEDPTGRTQQSFLTAARRLGAQAR